MSGCTDCGQAGQTDLSSGNPVGGGPNNGVTYNDGQGTGARNMLISGPLSEVITEQLNVIFKRTPLNLSDEQQDTYDEVMAKENVAQDHALRDAFKQASASPENDIVLRSINVQDIKSHVQRMLENKATNEDLLGTHQINVFTGDIDTLMDGQEMSSYDMQNVDDVILVTKPVPNDVDGKQDNPLIVKPGGTNPISYVLSLPVRTAVDQGDYPTVADKVEALERIYPGIRIHASVEAFAAATIKRLCK